MALGLDEVRIQRWSKVSKDGYPIPSECPFCRSKKTTLATYPGDPRKYVECEGCFQVIFEYPGGKEGRQFIRT